MSKISQEHTLSELFSFIKKFPRKDFYLEIAKGNVPKHIDYGFFGINEDIDVATYPQDIWSSGGIFTPPTTYRIHDIVSVSANDTAAGTGARTLRIYGVVSNGLADEIITLNGVTPVSTVNLYSDIYRMVIFTSGSGLTNAGIITATSATDGTVTAAIHVNGYNASRKGIRLIPPGYKGYIHDWQTSMTQSIATNSAINYLITKTSTGLWISRSVQTLFNSGASSLKIEYKTPLLLLAGEWVKVQCANVSANNTTIQCNVNLTLVQD